MLSISLVAVFFIRVIFKVLLSFPFKLWVLLVDDVLELLSTEDCEIIDIILW